MVFGFEVSGIREGEAGWFRNVALESPFELVKWLVLVNDFLVANLILFFLGGGGSSSLDQGDSLSNTSPLNLSCSVLVRRVTLMKSLRF